MSELKLIDYHQHQSFLFLIPLLKTNFKLFCEVLLQAILFAIPSAQSSIKTGAVALI